MSTRNAREEFEKHVGNKSGVQCAMLSWGDSECSWPGEEVERVLLHPGFTEKDYNDFLNRINENYNAGYGCQELFGTIWYTDDTWSDRREYDGSEWWEHQTCPTLPEEFNHACITASPELPQLPK